MNKKFYYIIAILFICFIFKNSSFINTSADDSATLLKTDGFTLDQEFLKALSNANTTPVTSDSIDSNNDGILSLEELNAVTKLNLACYDCNITNWSDLNYFKNLNTLLIEGANYKNVAFLNFTNDTIKELVLYSFSSNTFDFIYGLNNFKKLESLYIRSLDNFSLKYLVELNNSVDVCIEAPSVTDINAIEGDRLTLNTPKPSYNPSDSNLGPTSITIEGGEKITAYAGETINLSYSIEPKNKTGLVTWSTDKKYVAEFENKLFPKLTLWQAGTTTVTATCNYTSDSGVEYTLLDTILVEVIDPNATETPLPSQSEEPYLNGDVNFDKHINASDALAILKHAAQIEKLSESAISLGDLNQDELIDSRDALEVLKIAAGII